MKNEIAVNTFERAALLRCAGFEFVGAEPAGRRVKVVFADPEGKGEDLLRKHELDGVGINSRQFCEALLWAKTIVFSTRDYHNKEV